MGNCGSNLNCTGSDQPIQADLDIAGIGVLLSFAGTVVITYIAILVGYLSDSLPDASLTDLDRAFLFKISQWCRKVWPKNGLLRTAFRQATAMAFAIIGFERFPEDRGDIDPKAKLERARKRRSKGLERFILALSDQQLVTGLAVLIAGHISLCTRSVYHYGIIAALAWCSSTTHLSTLAVLRVYLTEHPKTRDWRVVTMLAVLGLLVVTQTALISGVDASIPSKCLFQSSGGTSTSSDSSIDPLYLIQSIFVTIFLVKTYSDRIFRLYSHDPDWSTLEWLFDAIMGNLQGRSCFDNIERIIIESSEYSETEQGTVLRSIRDRRCLAKLTFRMTNSRPGRLAQMILRIRFISQEIRNTFLSELLTLTFGVTYGMVHVAVARESVPTAGFVGDPNAMSFGQLVPLLLMALPILAAGEAYFEGHDNAKNTQTTEASSAKPRRKLILSTEHDIFWNVDQASLKGIMPEPQQSQPPDDLALRAANPSSKIPMQVLNGITQIRISALSAPEDDIQFIGRNDTESGLRFTPERRTASLRAIAANQALRPPEQSASPATGQPSVKTGGFVPMPFNPWNIFAALVIVSFLFWVHLAICLAGPWPSPEGTNFSYTLNVYLYVLTAIYILALITGRIIQAI